MRFVDRKAELESLSRFYREDPVPVYPSLRQEKGRKDASLEKKPPSLNGIWARGRRVFYYFPVQDLLMR